MENSKNKKLIKVLYFLLIGGALIMGIYQYYSKIVILSEKKELKNSSFKMLVYGKINEISKMQKSSRKWISYAFTYKNKYYHREIMDVFSYNYKFDYVGKQFPIVIDSLHPEMNFILFHKRDYKYFGYLAPDSMNWVFSSVEPLGFIG
jgi:hypothetical protein